MKAISIEIKSPCKDLDKVASTLIDLNANYIGKDFQTDTYFDVKSGRLKLRQGNIENNLIYYNRREEPGTKKSEVILQKLPDENSGMLEVLLELFDDKVTVVKKRRIFFIENVKFHLDEVEDLGTFIEIEALDTMNEFTDEYLSDQCNKYIDLFEIDRKKLIDKSYSDMLLEKETINQ